MVGYFASGTKRTVSASAMSASAAKDINGVRVIKATSPVGKLFTRVFDSHRSIPVVRLSVQFLGVFPGDEGHRF